MTDHFLVIFLLEDRIQIFKKEEQSNHWQVVPIKGESSFKHHRNKDTINTVLDECNERLNIAEQFLKTKVTVIYTPILSDWLCHVMSELQRLNNKSVQLFLWNELFDFATQGSTITENDINSDWLINNIIDYTQLDLREDNKLKIFKTEFEKQIKELEAKNKELETRNNTLASENDKLKNKKHNQNYNVSSDSHANIELLLSFLPSIFKNFWHTVRPDELASIVGQLTIPQIPSPYHNPTNSAIRIKKNQFISLDDNQKQLLVSYCQLLAQHYDLECHFEFKPLIGVLD